MVPALVAACPFGAHAQTVGEVTVGECARVQPSSRASVGRDRPGLPPSIRWQVRAGEQPEEWERVPNYRAILGGALVFGVGYSAAAGSATWGSGSHWLYVPVVGPWVEMADEGGWPIALDGLLQGVGAGVTLAGVFLGEKRQLGSGGVAISVGALHGQRIVGVTGRF